MHTNIERERKHGLVITGEDLKAIEILLSENYGPLEYSAFCSEGSQINFDNLGELIAFENPNFRRIERLILSAGDTSDRSCSVTFASRISSACSLSISDTQDKRALKVADELGLQLNECKPAYSALARVDPFLAVSGILLVCCSINVWRYLLVTGRFVSGNMPVLDAFYLMLPFLIVMIVTLRYVSRLWEWLFPKVWFSIGRQIKEFDKRSRARNLIFAGIFLTAAVSIASNFFTYFMTKP